MSFDNDNRKSFIYRKDDERSEMISSTFIKGLEAFPAYEFAPDPIPDLDNLIAESGDSAYLQAAFFQKENEKEQSKYFMILNRRCSPFIDYTSVNKIGGRRLVTMKMNPLILEKFSNWKIYDLETGDTVRTISKNDSNYIFLGDFMPGEGKLYKLAPVMQEGGRLVANEECSGSFNCKDEVYNNGYDIKIIPGITISFSANGRIGMTGGKFSSGYSSQSQSTAPVVLKGLNNNNWKGINLSGCSEVKIANTTFSNILPEDAGAIQLTNCLNTSLLNNTFNSTDSVHYGLSMDYILNENESNITLLVNQNHFNNLNKPLKCISYGSTVIPITLDGNIFTISSTGNTAVLLSNISGGVVKNNFITNYITGINFISSTTDLYGNSIVCSNTFSNSITEESFSNINLGKSGKYYTGGHNNLQAGNNNILPNNSNFNIDNGYNVFNILNTSSHHFDGTFPKTGIDVSVPAIKNCFHINSAIQNPVSNVKYFETNNLVQFQFNPTNCIPFVQNEFVIINNFDPNNSNNSYNDTIFFAAEGSGEGISSKVESRIKKIESENLKVLYDSVSIGIRMKNYEKIITNSILILNNYTDSIQSISIIPKIYLASLRIDTTGNKITELKAILKTLILNNPNNEPLISQSYYFIQKCKVALSQYQSAMTGFQQIINQNPYSYEGLVASWDYAATSLLLSGGSGGGEKDLEIGSSDLEINKSESSEMDINEEVKSQIQNSKSQILNDDPNDKYDTKIFTKEDRQVLRTNIYKSFESSRDKVTEKNKSLEKKIKDGTADEQEKTEFKNKTILKEIVKAKKPHNITEHVNFVNKDIQILFGSEKDNSIIETNNLIPTEFNLSQNYPNPFNPKTKITFDLPVDAKVKLIIYDMLGKEIIRLVNNEFRSVGRYKVDFNGSNLSSGVYFYKLETEGEKNFSLTKRMVLIK